MIRNKPVRRGIAIALMFLGGVLIFLTPPVWVGAIPLALGALLEIIGVTLERGAGK